MLDDSCAEVARLLSERMLARLEEEDFSATNEAVARELDVHEKQVRQYRSGKKRLPLGALLLLPLWLVDALLDEVRYRRHRTPDADAGLSSLRGALERLERVEPGSLDEARRWVLVRELGAAQGRIGALLGQLAKGGAR